jgi:hypothetical protein
VITEKMQDNWFDLRHGRHLERMSAEDALQIVAADPRVISAVEDALSRHDADCQAADWCGPSRTQVIRTAIAEVLQQHD